MLHISAKTCLEEDISIHIFSVSAAMVGVCLTVIGLIHVVSVLGAANTLADDLLAFDSFVFLLSCLLAYWALRTRGSRRMHRLEQIADGLFIVALTVMVVICGIITYSISFPQTSRARRSTPSAITAAFTRRPTNSTEPNDLARCTERASPPTISAFSPENHSLAQRFTSSLAFPIPPPAAH